jgi:hypothetical protein
MMGRVCGTYEGEKRCIQSFDGEDRDHLGGLGVEGKIVLKWMLNNFYGCIDSIELVRDGDRWRDLVNAVMNLRF